MGGRRRPPLPLPGPKGAAIAKRDPPAVPGADRRPGALTDHTAAPLSAPREQPGSPSSGGILLLQPAPGGRQGPPGGALNSTYLLRGRGWPRTYHHYFGPHQAARVFTFFQSLQVGIPTQGAPSRARQGSGRGQGRSTQRLLNFNSGSAPACWTIAGRFARHSCWTFSCQLLDIFCWIFELALQRHCCIHGPLERGNL